MQAQKRAVRRNSNFENLSRPTAQDPADQRAAAVTTAEKLILDDANVELIRDAASGRLHWWVFHLNSCRVAQRVEFQDRVSASPGINPSILRAITWPSKCGHIGSTGELFEAVRESLTNRGFPTEVALPSTYFIFSTWFSEFLPAAPCLSITGPTPEAELLLQLLGCMVRHPLPLREVTRRGLLSLPMELQLTLLIAQEHINPSLWGLLCASNYRNSNVSWREGLRNIYCSKAVYRKYKSAGDDCGNDTLRVNLSPSRGRLPLLNARDMRELAEELQPKLLAYRRRNIAKVCQSQFDFPEFNSEIRILARVFGAAIVDAPDLQAGLDPLLREYHEETQEARLSDLRCVAIEAALYHCHNGGEEKLYVGKITSAANVIMKGRGQIAQLEAKEIGGIIRLLGLSPRRDKSGYSIRLTDGIRRLIHQLAANYEVADWQANVSTCLNCAENLGIGAGRGRRGAPQM